MLECTGFEWFLWNTQGREQSVTTLRGFLFYFFIFFLLCLSKILFKMSWGKLTSWLSHYLLKIGSYILSEYHSKLCCLHTNNVLKNKSNIVTLLLKDGHWFLRPLRKASWNLCMWNTDLWWFTVYIRTMYMGFFFPEPIIKTYHFCWTYWGDILYLN